MRDHSNCFIQAPLFGTLGTVNAGMEQTIGRDETTPIAPIPGNLPENVSARARVTGPPCPPRVGRSGRTSWAMNSQFITGIK